MKKTIKKPLCVVVGLDITGLGLLRSLASSGARVIGVAGSHSDCGVWSRLNKQLWFLKEGGVTLTESLISLGKTLHGEKAALFLTADSQALEVSKNHDILSEYFVINLPEYKAVETLTDKCLFTEYAAKKNLPIPKTFVVRNAHDVELVSKGVQYPCILKPYFRSVEWIKKGFPKVFKVTGREELMDIYGMIEPYNKKSIIQEWVKGGDDDIYFCLIYQPVRAVEPILFYGKKIRQWPPETGSTSMAVPSEDPGIGEISLKLFKGLNVSGFGSVEFKRDAETGRLLIMEPTVGRVNLQSAITDAAGVRLPYYALCDMLGLSLPELERHPRQVKWLCEPHEINNILRHLRSGEFSALLEYMRSIKGRRRYALFAWNDPMPLFCFFYIFVKHKVLKLLPE